MWSPDAGRLARPGPPTPHRPLPGVAILADHRARAVGRPEPEPPDLAINPRRALWLARFAALALTLVAVLPVARAERPSSVEVAMVTDLAGRVERQPHAIEQWAAVALDEGVALFDAMRTWERSTAELRFVDGTVVMLDEKTRLRISPVLFDPAQAPEEVRLALAEGSAEVRAGRSRLWVETPDGVRHPVDPGEALRFSVGDDPRSPRVGPPTQPMPADIEAGAPKPAADRPGDRIGGDGGLFDPTAGRADPTAPADGVVVALPGTIGVDVDPGVGGEGGVIELPPLTDAPDMPGPPDPPGPPDMPGDPPDEPLPPLLGDLVPGGDLLGDLVPDGLVPVLDLPAAPTEGRVRVSVEVRRR